MPEVKCSNWTLLLQLSNGRFRTLSDMPDDVANPIDEYITELELKGEFEDVKSQSKGEHSVDNGDSSRDTSKTDD